MMRLPVIDAIDDTSDQLDANVTPAMVKLPSILVQLVRSAIDYLQQRKGTSIKQKRWWFGVVTVVAVASIVYELVHTAALTPPPVVATNSNRVIIIIMAIIATT